MTEEGERRKLVGIKESMPEQLSVARHFGNLTETRIDRTRKHQLGVWNSVIPSLTPPAA